MNIHVDSRDGGSLRWGAVAPAAALVAVAALAYYAWTFGSFERFMAVLDHCPETFCDFQRHYLPMARHIFDGTGPVDGFFYSAFFALLLAPLGFLSDGAALWIWALFQVALALGLLIVPLLRARRPGFAAMVAYMALFFSAHSLLHNFKWGQVSVLLTLCVLGAAALWQRGHWLAAGFLLAFATSIKAYPAWFALVPLMRRDWKLLGAFAGSCVLLLGVVPVLALGGEPTLRFHLAVADQLRTQIGMLVGDPNSQSLQGVMQRLARAAGKGSNHLALVTPLRAAALLVAVGAAWSSTRRAGDDAWASFLILFCALPLVTPTCWPHYFVFLPAAFLYLLTELPRARGPRTAVLILGGAAALLASLPCWQFMSNPAFGPAHPRLPPPGLYSYWALPFFANALTFLALLVTVGGGRWRPRGDSNTRRAV